MWRAIFYCSSGQTTLTRWSSSGRAPSSGGIQSCARSQCPCASTCTWPRQMRGVPKLNRTVSQTWRCASSWRDLAASRLSRSNSISGSLESALIWSRLWLHWWCWRYRNDIHVTEFEILPSCFKFISTDSIWWAKQRFGVIKPRLWQDENYPLGFSANSNGVIFIVPENHIKYIKPALERITIESVSTVLLHRDEISVS